MKILVYGEIILDRYYLCTTERKAPEADIPIYLVNNIEDKLGGAANIALNLKDHCDIEFISVLGDDSISLIIIDILNKNYINNKIFVSNRKSIIKNRTICNNQIIHRLDIEDSFDIPEYLINEIILYFEKKILTEKIDGIILSDYNKGIMPNKLCQNIINLCNKNNILTFVDPKIKNIEKYKNCTFFKPNLYEAKIINNNIECTENELIKSIYNLVECKYLIITKNSDGLVGYDGINNYIINHKNKINVIDVTGAGDITLSILSYIFILSKDFEFSCKISNYIAGNSVEYLGNYKFNINDIINSNKLLYSNQINIIQNLRKIHKNIVFTNGCFDIVHIGHIKLLKYSKSLGDFLILGLNSDQSISEIKGTNRPINNQNNRIEFIELLDIVDYIIIFDEQTPSNIIKHLKPDILVKGSDYNINNIIGKEYCNKIVFFDLIPNFSTTNIIEKIKNK